MLLLRDLYLDDDDFDVQFDQLDQPEHKFLDDNFHKFLDKPIHQHEFNRVHKYFCLDESIHVGNRIDDNFPVHVHDDDRLDLDVGDVFDQHFLD